MRLKLVSFVDILSTVGDSLDLLIVLVVIPMVGRGGHHKVRGFKVQFVTDASSLLVVVIIKTVFFWALSLS